MENSIVKIFEGQEVKVKVEEKTTMYNLVCTAKICGLTRTITKNGKVYEVIRWKDKGISEKLDSIRLSTNVDNKHKLEIAHVLDEIENANDRNTIYMSSWLSRRLTMECHSSKAMRYKDYLATLDDDFHNGRLFTNNPNVLDLLNKQCNILVEKATEHDAELEDHNNRIQKIEQETYIAPSQKNELLNIRTKKVKELIGDKNSVAYKNRSFRGRVYADLSRQYNNYFNIPSYSYTPKLKVDEAKEFINSYNLSAELNMELNKIGKQVEFN